MRASALTLIVLMVPLLSTSVAAREPEEAEPTPPPVSPAAPMPFVIPEGIYYVTETYVADVVSQSGPTTTYSTATVHESTGSYARVIDTVDTGASSIFDGAAFNGRGALSDGRPLAGTYYENFVLTPDGFVAVSIVFFQDDSETSRNRSVSRTATLGPSPMPVDPSRPRAPTASQPPSHRPTGPVVTPRPFQPIVRAGVALAPDGPTLASAELLRGRAVPFWIRAFVDGAAVPVRSWRLLSSGPDYAAPTSGSDQPFVAQWLRMPSPGTAWPLRFEVFTDFGVERLEAEIAVLVRSPALVD